MNFSTLHIDNSLPAGVHPVQHMFILQLKCGIFYMDEIKCMCFQFLNDLVKEPTEHLVHLRIACHVFANLAQNYHFVISMELKNRMKELAISD